MPEGPTADGPGRRQLCIGVLGPLLAEVAGRPVSVGGPRPQALLAVLVAAGGRPVHGDRLASEIYGEPEPSDPIATVRVHVANLRRAFAGAGVGAELITTVRGGYALRLAPEETDAGRFEAACRAVRETPDHEAALALIDGALALRRGEPYHGLADLPTVRPEALRLAALGRGAQVDRAERLLALGRHRSAIADLESLVARSPEDEELRALLMLALYRSGRQTAALRCAVDLRRHLRREHGVEPSPRLLKLERAILLHDPMLDRLFPAPVARTDEAPATPGGSTPAPGAEPYTVLSEGARRVLAAAAAWGSPVQVGDLTAILGTDDPGRGVPGAGGSAGDQDGEPGADSVRAALDEAVAAGVLTVDGGFPRRWRFADETVRQAVYGSIGAFALAALHRRCADLLEAAGAAGDPDHVAELAAHAARAEAAGLAPLRHVSWLVAAGHQSTARHDVDGAVRWLTRALHATDGSGVLGGDDRVAVRLALGDALWRAGRGDEARRTFTDVIDLARHRGDGGLLARAAVGLAAGGFAGSLPFADRRVEDLADLIDQALVAPGADGVRARLLGHRAQAHAALAEPAAARRVSEEAVAVADGTGDARCLADVLVSRSSALCQPVDLSDRLVAVERLTSLADQLGDDELVAVALRHRVECLVERDELDAARAVLGQAELVAARLGQPLVTQRTQLLRIMLTLLAGDWEAAQRSATDALSLGEGAGDRTFSWVAHTMQSAVVHYNRHDVADLASILRVLRAQAADRRAGHADAPDMWAPLDCLIACWTGRAGEAQARLRPLVADGCRRVPRDQGWFTNIVLLVNVADVLDDDWAASQLQRVLEPFQGLRATVPGIIALAPVTYYLGVLERLRGRLDRAERRLWQAARSSPSHPELWALAHLAAVLSGQRDPERRSEAAAVAADVTRRAQAAGSRAVLGRLESLETRGS